MLVTKVCSKVSRADAAPMASIARAEDASRTAAETVQIAAGGASLLAVGFTLGRAGQAHSPTHGLLIALALASIALAWSSLNTICAIRYARLYYSHRKAGSTSIATPLTAGISPTWR